ncbi:VIT1/CCC1 transporter family protein [Undibacterium sp. SXout11W]|uniref:VIT1/CCC1 transporter family protein n=1 Tax=Undibacterium sp. SXout11W TaxID=3413050 RepID=UPI003BF2A2CD
MTAHTHRPPRSGWLRTAVLGANNGLLSIFSLLLGVTAAYVSNESFIVAGFAGLIGGALALTFTAAAGKIFGIAMQ